MNNDWLHKYYFVMGHIFSLYSKDVYFVCCCAKLKSLLESPRTGICLATQAGEASNAHQTIGIPGSGRGRLPVDRTVTGRQMRNIVTHTQTIRFACLSLKFISIVSFYGEQSSMVLLICKKLFGYKIWK